MGQLAEKLDQKKRDGGPLTKRLIDALESTAEVVVPVMPGFGVLESMRMGREATAGMTFTVTKVS